MGLKSRTWQDRFWALDPHQLTPWRRRALSALKIGMQSGQAFIRDLCPLRASALTLYTLLSIVPVIAVAFGIAKGFGFQRLLEQLLLQLPAQDTLLKQIIDFAQKLLAKTQGEVVAGIGIAALLWVVISLVGEVEHTFNAIWKIPRDRTFSRKFSDYLSLSLLAPILLIVASSSLVLAEHQMAEYLMELHLPGWVSGMFFNSLQLIPLGLLSALFALVFILLPNQNVGYRGGVVAGALTGVMYYAWQWLYVNLQIGVSSYNAIYGSFAAVPLFVVWLHVSWMLVLFGCQLAYYIQNDSHFSDRHPFFALSFHTRKVMALRICQLVVKRFASGLPSLNAHQIAIHLHLATSTVQLMLHELTDCHLLVVLDSGDRLPVYQPAVDSRQLTLGFVLRKLENHGAPLSQTTSSLEDAMQQLEQRVLETVSSRSLLEYD